MSNVKSVKPQPVPLVVIGGKTFSLEYTLFSFGLLEEEFGSIEAAMEAMETGSTKALVSILWAGIINEHLDESFQPLISKNFVARGLSMRKVDEMGGQLKQALEIAMPEREAAGADPLLEKVKTVQEKNKKAFEENQNQK